MLIFFFWFRCIIRYWNILLSSKNPLLEKVVRADLLIANRSDTWTYQVLHALQDLPASQQFLNAIRSHESSHLKQSKLTLREHIIGRWRELDSLTPQDNYLSSRIMKSYHTFWCTFGDCSWLVGWQKKKSQACVTYLPSLGYFQQSQPCTFLPSPFWP